MPMPMSQPTRFADCSRLVVRLCLACSAALLARPHVIDYGVRPAATGALGDDSCEGKGDAVHCTCRVMMEIYDDLTLRG